MFKQLFHTAALLATLTCATFASAHAHLVSQSPAADSTGGAPDELCLRFSEGVEPSFSKVTLARDGQVAEVKSIATDLQITNS